jgi:hypothetical protein
MIDDDDPYDLKYVRSLRMLRFLNKIDGYLKGYLGL